MRTLLKRAVLLIVFAVLAGCATPQRIALKADSTQYIDTVDVNICLNQQEINADIERSNISMYTGGGLLFAMIDSAVDNSRAKNAEILVQPIRDALIDYDFGKVFSDKIDSELKSVEWININEVSVSHDTSSDHYKNSYALSKATAVLFINTSYSFSPDFKALKISSYLRLFPNTDELKTFAYKWSDSENPVDDRNCMYRNSLVRMESLDREAATREEAIGFWGENNAALVKHALENGAGEMAKMIASDIQSK